MPLPPQIIAGLAFVVVGCSLIVDGLRSYRREQARLARLLRQATPPVASPVRPAWMVDNSDTSDECPACYIEHLQRGQLPRHEDGSYLTPAGAPVICARHRASPLARAIHIYTIDTNERKATR